VNVYSVSQYLRYAYGSLCSSARDLARFAQALASGELLPDSLHRLMITPAGAAERFGYGFGIGVDEFEGRLRLEHGGMVTGFESSLMVLPDDSIAVVVLANANPAGAGSLASELLRIAIGLEPTGEGTLPVGWSAAGRSGGGGGVHWLRRMGSGLHVDSWSDDVFFAPGTTDAASLAYAPTFYPPRGRPEGSLVGIVVASDDPAGPRLFYELDGLGRVGVRLEEAGQTRTVLAPTTPEGGVGRTATMGIRADGDALIIEWGGSEVTRLPLGVVPTRVRVGVSVGSGLSVHVEGAGPSGTGPPARRPGHG
jgi:hypothetical protein